jgi:cell division cycle protein 37
MDIEEVRKALQLRWDLFSSFPISLQNALKTENLEEVNKVLGAMEVPEAEEVVEKLQMGGMLMFSEPGVRDATGNTT